MLPPAPQKNRSRTSTFSPVSYTHLDVYKRQGLSSASGLIRNEIGRQVRMRRVPQRIFKMDHSMEYGEHIDSILDSMDFDSYQKDEEEGGEEPAK